MTKLVTKGWVHVSLGLVSGGGRVESRVKLHVLFGGIIFGKFICGKMG